MRAVLAIAFMGSLGMFSTACGAPTGSDTGSSEQGETAASSPTVNCGFKSVTGAYTVDVRQPGAAAQLQLDGVKKIVFKPTTCRQGATTTSNGKELWQDGPSVEGEATLTFGDGHEVQKTYSHNSYRMQEGHRPFGEGAPVPNVRVPGPISFSPLPYVPNSSTYFGEIRFDGDVVTLGGALVKKYEPNDPPTGPTLVLTPAQ